jgi:pimeloyl-ACP methyl ester carboxylesterase
MSVLVAELRTNLAQVAAAALLAVTAACGGGGAAKKPAEAQAAPAARAPGAPMFSRGEVLAYSIQDAAGKALGRVHGTYLETEDGFRQVVTRIEVARAGDSVEQIEHAITFRKDMSPVSYKRLSSRKGRYELEFGSSAVHVIENSNTKDVHRDRVQDAVLPDQDLMTLAMAFDREGLKPGATAVLDAFNPESLEHETLKLRAYLEGTARAVDLPGGKATLDAAGKIVRLELSERGWVMVPEVPPGSPPRVLWQPPTEYKKPEAARWEDKAVKIAVSGGVLAGAISIPKDRAEWTGGRAPAVVFLSDRGGQDRNGHQGSLDLGTWELLDRLADSGIVVLRVDDRGVGASTSTVPVAQQGYALDVADGLAMVKQLESEPAVNPDRIFVIGMGTGGITAIGVAGKSELGGLIFIGTPNKRFHELLAAEVGADGERIMRLAIAALRGSEAAAAQVPAERLRLYRASKAMILEQADLDFKAALQAIDKPMAFFQGLKDFEVNWKTDTQKLVEAARKAGRSGETTRVKLYSYENVDHLMKAEPKESSLLRYADPTRRIDPRVLEDLPAWIRAHGK